MRKFIGNDKSKIILRLKMVVELNIMIFNPATTNESRIDLIQRELTPDLVTDYLDFIRNLILNTENDKKLRDLEKMIFKCTKDIITQIENLKLNLL
jgi:hypothetical protein